MQHRIAALKFCRFLHQEHLSQVFYCMKFDWEGEGEGSFCFWRSHFCQGIYLKRRPSPTSKKPKGSPPPVKPISNSAKEFVKNMMMRFFARRSYRVAVVLLLFNCFLERTEHTLQWHLKSNSCFVNAFARTDASSALASNPRKRQASSVNKN
jgi:hypothetical protein